FSSRPYRYRSRIPAGRKRSWLAGGGTILLPQLQPLRCAARRRTVRAQHRRALEQLTASSPHMCVFGRWAWAGALLAVFALAPGDGGAASRKPAATRTTKAAK